MSIVNLKLRLKFLSICRKFFTAKTCIGFFYWLYYVIIDDFERNNIFRRWYAVC